MSPGDFPVKRSGIHYKDGKLYIFTRPAIRDHGQSPRGKIVVIRPWPDPAAWCKEIGRNRNVFHAYRPRIDLRTIDFDYLELTEQEPLLQDLVHKLVDIFGIPQPEKTVQVMPFDVASAGKPPETAMNRELRRAFASVPEHVRTVTKQFGEIAQWNIMTTLIRVPELIEMENNPGLMYLHCHLNTIGSHRVTKPLRTVRQLIKKPRKTQAAYHGLPGRAVRILEKVCPEAMDAKEFMIFIRKLRDENQEFYKVIAHLPSINLPVLRVLTNAGLYRRSSFNFLKEISFADSDYEKDCLLPVMDELTALLEKEECAEIKFKSAKQMIDVFFTMHQNKKQKEYLEMNLPAPPYPGAENLIKPLATAEEIVRHGITQKNCVMSWIPRVVNGEAFLYAYSVSAADNSTETGTVALLNRKGKWRLGEILASGNGAPCFDATTAIKHWFAACTKKPAGRAQ